MANIFQAPAALCWLINFWRHRILAQPQRFQDEWDWSRAGRRKQATTAFMQPDLQFSTSSHSYNSNPAECIASLICSNAITCIESTTMTSTPIYPF
jgi:hypothetical protein